MRPMRHRHFKSAATALLAAALLAACSGIPLRESDQEIRDRYSAYAGEPVDHFVWLSHFDSWQPVGHDELVVFTGPSDAYLLKVAPPCHDLQFANSIGLTSTGGSVSSRFDSVLVRSGSPGFGDRCQIEEIRKVDYRRMRADMRLEAQRAREAKSAATPQP